MSSPSQQPTVPTPSLARRLGRFLIITGAVAGVAMAVADPTGGGVNPGPGIVGLGLVFLLLAGPGGQPPGPHDRLDQAPTLSGRLGRFLLVVGAVVGVTMAVVAPGDANPGSVIIALGLVFLVFAWRGRPRAHDQENEAQQLRNQS